MQLSLKDLNKRIARDIHADVELVRADGYFYLHFATGEIYAEKSIMVPYLSDMPNSKWLDEARAFVEEYAPKKLERVSSVDPDFKYYEGAATPEHQKEAEDLRDRMLHRANEYRSAEHSPRVLKKFEVTHSGSLTFITIEIGMEGDEGTLASVFCRDYRHISLVGSGRRQRWSLLNAKLKKDRKGYWNCLHALTR